MGLGIVSLWCSHHFVSRQRGGLGHLPHAYNCDDDTNKPHNQGSAQDWSHDCSNGRRVSFLRGGAGARARGVRGCWAGGWVYSEEVFCVHVCVCMGVCVCVCTCICVCMHVCVQVIIVCVCVCSGTHAIKGMHTNECSPYTRLLNPPRCVQTNRNTIIIQTERNCCSMNWLHFKEDLSCFMLTGVLFLSTTNWLTSNADISTAGMQSSCDVCPEEDRCPGVETSTFVDMFMKPICGREKENSNQRLVATIMQHTHRQ